MLHCLLCIKVVTFSFHTHTFGRKVWRASAVKRRGVSKDSPEADELEEHETAVRNRVLEIRLFVRPKLDSFTVNAPQDPTNCKMGLYSAMMKELSKEKKTINPASHFFLPLLFEALRRNAREFSEISQNYKPPEIFEELLLAKIKEIEEVITPPLPLHLSEHNTEQARLTGCSILEDREAEEEEEEPDRNLFPIFRKMPASPTKGPSTSTPKRKKNDLCLELSSIVEDCTKMDVSDEEWLEHEINGSRLNAPQKNDDFFSQDTQ